MAQEQRARRREYRRRIPEKDLRKKTRRTIFAIALILVLAASILGYRTAQLYKQKASYTAQVQKLEEQIEQESIRHNELLRKKEEVTSDSYIEAQAREKLGLIYKGEGEYIVKRKK